MTVARIDRCLKGAARQSSRRISVHSRHSVSTLSFLLILALFLWVVIADAQTQKSKAGDTKAHAAANEPRFGDYKGVKLGMTPAEVHRLLGAPTQTFDDQDFYIVSESETVQVCYDKSQSVHAISIDYVGELSGAPDYRNVVGDEVTIREDGSIWKLVRFEKSGFWVSYNRTAGTPAMVTVTMQKITKTARGN